MADMVSILADINKTVDGLSDNELIKLPSMIAAGGVPSALARPTLDLLAVVARPMILNAALERGLLDDGEQVALFGSPPMEQPEAPAN